MKTLYLVIPLAPLFAAIIAGLGGRLIGRAGAHWVTIVGVGISFFASCAVLAEVMNGTVFNGTVYTWLTSGGTRFEIGFLIDRLTALMMVVVSFVSWMVHIYTIGYMAEDPGYQRFFSYISLFTFSMLMLVMANNFLQLFFGWEAVGLVSYLLIGFWHNRPTAIYANLKAFLVNRVGDFGFLLGVALILAYFGTLDYANVFAQAPNLAGDTLELIPGKPWLLISVICVCLFIGAMGKSAQFPLHVWLPDSMEGPTPISALIHAATMVTAGIFMVARMSPLFEHSEAALSFVIVIGAITMFFMALIALVQYDIKRVVAYSTLSQLGYMTVALGASAYPAAIFHLMTHAFFKAALFLGAGSVIIALHHQQDMRYMGGLRRYMPITYLVVLIGALANSGFVGFAGFFSKETIIDATRLATTPGASFAYVLALATVFVTAFYSFRLVFYAFHGAERFDTHASGKAHGSHDEHHGPPHESPLVVTIPLVLLAIPSICAGWTIGTVLYGGFFADSMHIAPEHNGLATLAEEYHGVVAMMLHAPFTVAFWLALGGIGLAWYFYIARPELPGAVRDKFGLVTRILENKYGFDDAYQKIFGDGAVKVGTGLWKGGDVGVIDGVMIDGSARAVGAFAAIVRRIQTGFIYQYAFTMIIGVAVGLAIWLAPWFWRVLTGS